MDREHADSPFPSTRWSVVLSLREAADSTSASQALRQLCEAYWYPLYIFARRRGFAPSDAEDATQGFFAYLLARNLFAAAEPQLGKLRTFLLTAFDRFLGDARDRERAQKRGGDCELIALDATDGESRYAYEPLDIASPERLFERSWAMTVLRSALVELSTDEASAGRAAQFRALQPFLSPDATAAASYPAAAQRISLSEGAVRQIVSRLRRKFRDSLRRQIADTLREPTDVQIEEELFSLRAALRG